MTECNERFAIMPAAEVEWLLDDLMRELQADPDNARARANLTAFETHLRRFMQDWRQLCAMHGVSGRSSEAFEQLAKTLHAGILPHAKGLRMRLNGASALLVLEKRLLQHLVVTQATNNSGIDAKTDSEMT